MNERGHPQTRVASHPGHQTALRHGVYDDGRALALQARGIAEAIMDAPHTVELDAIGAFEIGNLEALIEAIDREQTSAGVVGKRGEPRAFIDLPLRASRRFAEWLDRYGITPQGRASWGATLAQGGLAAEITRRRAELGDGSA